MELQSLLGLAPIIRNALPSYRERSGMRLAPFDSDQIGLANSNLNAKQLYPEEVNRAMGRQRLDAYNRVSPNEDLNLFAISEDPNNFTGFLNSDAVTGMDANELNMLDDQFVASHPQAIPEAVDAIPGIMNTVNTTGMFPKLLGTAGTVSALAKLYSTLSSAPLALPMM